MPITNKVMGIAAISLVAGATALVLSWDRKELKGIINGNNVTYYEERCFPFSNSRSLKLKSSDSVEMTVYDSNIEPSIGDGAYDSVTKSYPDGIKVEYRNYDSHPTLTIRTYEAVYSLSAASISHPIDFPVYVNNTFIPVHLSSVDSVFAQAGRDLRFYKAALDSLNAERSR